MGKDTEKYFAIGAVLGLVVGVLTFIGAYIYCIATYGFLLGLGLGWLPSGILAVMVFFATWLLWGPALALIIIGIVLIMTGN